MTPPDLARAVSLRQEGASWAVVGVALNYSPWHVLACVKASGITLPPYARDRRVLAAHAYRGMGWTWARIAEELGYASPESAKVSYRRWCVRQAGGGDGEAGM